MRMYRLTEAPLKSVMTSREQQVKKKLIAMLKDDGHGHHHAKYAKRLEDFVLEIVSSRVKPEMTAAIDIEHGKIYISDGFLTRPGYDMLGADAKVAAQDAIFRQLNVLLRHELAHALLRHQIRMMHKIVEKYGETGHSKIKMSMSIHDLLNCIEDFEISNRIYTAEDKQTVKNMWLNGKVIGGLVTDSDRPGWEKMTVEEMHDELVKEIAKADAALRKVLAGGGKPDDILDTQIGRRVAHYTKMYQDTERPSAINMPIKDFMQTNYFKALEKNDKDMADLIKALEDSYQSVYKENESKPATLKKALEKVEKTAKNLLNTIAKSNVYEAVNLVDLNTGKKLEPAIYTPEDKQFIMEVIKMYAGVHTWLPPYEKWLKKVTDEFSKGKYSKADIQKIYDALNAQGAA